MAEGSDTGKESKTNCLEAGNVTAWWKLNQEGGSARRGGRLRAKEQDRRAGGGWD